MTQPDTLHTRCHCCASKDQPHQSRDRGPTCTWCGRDAIDPIHDPRLGRVLGAQIKANELAARAEKQRRKWLVAQVVSP